MKSLTLILTQFTLLLNINAQIESGLESVISEFGYDTNEVEAAYLIKDFTFENNDTNGTPAEEWQLTKNEYSIFVECTDGTENQHWYVSRKKWKLSIEERYLEFGRVEVKNYSTPKPLGFRFEKSRENILPNGKIELIYKAKLKESYDYYDTVSVEALYTRRFKLIYVLFDYADGSFAIYNFH